MHNYISYQEKISDAEKDILNGNRISALTKYESISKHFTFFFPRDAYMGTQLAAYEKEYDAAIHFLEKAIEGGCNSPFLKKNTHIRKMLSKTKLDVLCEYYHSSYLKNIDNALKHQVEDMFIQDRKYFLRYKNNIFSKNVKFSEWVDNAEILAGKIINITKAYGFPSYSLIGTDRVRRFRCSLTSDMAIIILAHYPEINVQFKKLLFSEVQKGNLPVRGFAFLRDVVTYKRIKRQQLQGDEFDDYKYGSLLNLVAISNHKEINLNREKIGLPSLSFEIEKAKQNKKYLRNRLKYRLTNKSIEPNFHFLTEELF